MGMEMRHRSALGVFLLDCFDYLYMIPGYRGLGAVHMLFALCFGTGSRNHKVWSAILCEAIQGLFRLEFDIFMCLRILGAML